METKLTFLIIWAVCMILWGIMHVHDEDGLATFFATIGIIVIIINSIL